MAAAVVLTSLSAIAASTASAATYAPVRARQADSLVDAFGVNAHMEYGQTPYQNVSAVTAALRTLGARHIRDRITINPGQWAALRTLRAAGIKSDLIMGDPISANSTPAQLVNVVATQLPGVAESLEGANEWNLKNRPNWAAELRAHQSEVYRQAKANSATASLPVLGPALGRRMGFSELGNLSNVLDLGNNHQYPGGLQPSVHIADMIASERQVAGSKAQVFTESGYNTAVASTVGNLPVTERVEGYYAPKLLLEHFDRGVVRMYNYELLDQRPNPSFGDPEAHFGLLRNDMSPKPQYTALKNLLQLVSDPGPAFTPGTLAYSLSGASSDVRQVLLQKRDGRFYLILWRDASLYNPKSKTETPNAAVNVTVNLDRAGVMSVYRPSMQQAALALPRESSTLSVPLSDDIVALQIATGTSPVPPPVIPPRPVNGGSADVRARDSAGNVLRYAANGTGGFAAGRTTVRTGTGSLTALFDAGSFAATGHNDMLGRDSAGNLLLYPGTGTSLGAPVRVGTGWRSMTALAGAEDFNGDGHPDVLARDPLGNLYLYPGDGRSGWGTKTTIGTGWASMKTILSVGDFSGDGAADVIARDSAGYLQLYPGNGHGGFAGTRFTIGRGWGPFTALVAAGDFSGDGRPDLIARTSNGVLMLYPGTGTSGFGTPRMIGNGWSPLNIAG